MIKHTVKSIAVGAGLFLTTAIPTVMSEPTTQSQATQAVSKEDFDKLSAAVNKFRDEVKESFREQTDFLKRQDDRISRLEHIVGVNETRDPPPEGHGPPPPKRVIHVVHHHHYYDYYWCPPPWW